MKVTPPKSPVPGAGLLPKAPSAEPQPTGAPMVRDQFVAGADTRALEGQVAQRVAGIEKTARAARGGNVVARGFNSLINLVKGNRDAMDAASRNAVRALRTDLPRDLALYHDMAKAAGKNPAKIAAANEFLQGAMAKAQNAGNAFDQRVNAMQSSNKFWSGLTADVTAGLLVLGGTALCITGFGAPIGAGMIAGAFVAGGAASVGGHALLDSQYDFRSEALGNFLVGGVSSGAMVLTGGMSSGVTATIGRTAATQAVVGGSTAMAGEVAHGFQPGWATRVALGAGTGAVLGGATHGVASRLLGSGLSTPLATRAAQTGIGTVSGAVGSGGGAFAGEAMAGFRPGWQDRVTEQTLGGALAGTAYSFAPNLGARNQAAKAYRATKAQTEAAMAAPQAKVASKASGYAAETLADKPPVAAQVGKVVKNFSVEAPGQPGSKFNVGDVEFSGFRMENGKPMIRIKEVESFAPHTVAATPENLAAFGVVVPEQLGQAVPKLSYMKDAKPVEVSNAKITYISRDGKNMTLTDGAGRVYNMVPAETVLAAIPATIVRPSAQAIKDQIALHQELATKGMTSPRAIYDVLAGKLVTSLQKNPAILKAFADVKQPITSLADAPRAWERLTPAQQMELAPKIARVVTDQASATYRFTAPEVVFQETKGLAGYYQNGKVVLNPAEFKGSFVALLDTLVHEPTHAYQGYLARNLPELSKGLSYEMRNQVAGYQQGFKAENYVNPAPEALKGMFGPNNIRSLAAQYLVYAEVTKGPLSVPERHMVNEWWQKCAYRPLTPEQYTQVNMDLYNKWMGQYKNQALESHANLVSHTVTRLATGAVRYDWQPPFPKIPVRPSPQPVAPPSPFQFRRF